MALVPLAYSDYKSKTVYRFDLNYLLGVCLLIYLFFYRAPLDTLVVSALFSGILSVVGRYRKSIGEADSLALFSLLLTLTPSAAVLFLIGSGLFGIVGHVFLKQKKLPFITLLTLSFVITFFLEKPIFN